MSQLPIETDLVTHKEQEKGASTLALLAAGIFCKPQVVVVLALAGCGSLADQAVEREGAAVAAVSMDPAAVHERLLTMDSHLDTPALLVQPGFDITARHDPLRDYSQVDLPRMREGGLDGGFWVIYTPQGPLNSDAYDRTYRIATARSNSITTMTKRHPEDFELATTAIDAQRIVSSGKRIVYKSIENAYPVGEDLDRLDRFYDMGVRMLGPVHFANNQFADSATDPKGPRWQGLSPLGRQLVERANALGMILDASHAHDLVFDELLTLSKTPIILSHSGAKAIFDHPRNIDDTRLLRLAESGGVIQMNALGSYLRQLPPQPERGAALRALFAESNKIDPPTRESREALIEKRRAIDAQYPAQLASFEDYMAHFLHVLKLIGPNHVGIGADWDGGGGVVGMRDIAAFPRVTERLLAEGYTEDDLAKIWGGNVLRLLQQAETYRLVLSGRPAAFTLTTSSKQ